MTKIGFAISLYDKFDDLEILVDIIRSWKKKYIISVCCSKTDFIPEIRHLDIDVVCQPRTVAQLGMHNNSKKNKYAQNIRCTENVRASCENLRGCDYGVHLHSDCWFLNEEKLLELVNWVEHNKIKVATRGHGLAESFHPMRQAVFGSVDDHAIIWNVPWCKKHYVWDFKPEAMLYHRYGVHTQLGLVFGVKVGLDNWKYYPHTSLDAFGNKTRSLSPVNYDSVNEIIHVNVGALPGSWGRSIQHSYLKMYDNMQYALRGYQDPNVLYKLAEHNYKYDWWLSKCGFSKKQLAAISPVHKELFVKEMTLRKVVQNYKHKITDYIVDKMFKMPKDVREWYQTQGYIDELVGKENWTR